jgi:hypothetical protein
MLRYLPVFALTIPLLGHGQSYADSPFYRLAPGIPSTAHVEGWSHRSIKANGVVIDLSESVPWSSPDIDAIRGWSLESSVDRNKPAHTFHFYIQYDQLNVIFGYDLVVEPVEGIDKIKCIFSPLTDPESGWHNKKEISPVALPADLTPIVVNSGDAISFTTLPLGPDKIAVIHYIRLTRIDPESASAK